MAAPILLVDDDLQVISALKRLLAREGYEVVVATSAADAMIAFGHHLPALIVLAPSVESGRGQVVLEELKQHPDGQLAKVLLLGESVPGFGYPVAPLPPDDDLVKQINALIDPREGDWTISEPEKTVSGLEEQPELMPPPPQPQENAGWRTSPPREEDMPTVEAPAPADPTDPDLTPPDATPPAMPETGRVDAAPVEAPADESPGRRRDLEGALFGDLASLEEQAHSEIEAEAMASVQSQLASMPVDPELERLENEVRAEAQRRRQQREAAKLPVAPTVEPVAEQSAQFELEELDSPPAPATEPSAQASEARPAARLEPQTLDAVEQQRDEAAQREAELEAKVKEAEAKVERARAAWAAREAAARAAVESAEQALKSARSEADVQQRSRRGEIERLEREAEHVGSLVRKEREQRAALEEEREQKDAELERLRRQAFDGEARLKELDAALVKAQGAHEETRSELAQLSEEHQAVVLGLEEATQKLELETQRSRERSEAAAELEMKVIELQEAHDRAAEVARATREQVLKELEHERGSRATAEQHQAELLADLGKLELQLKDVRAQLEAEREAASQQLKTLREELEQARGEQQVERERASAAQSAAQRAEAQVKELEDRAVLPLAPKGKPPLTVPRTGTVKLGELARLIANLVLGGAECRVELGVPGGTRNLFVKRGQLVAAESSLPYETLPDRARRDGLIDGRQEADLQSVRGASAQELLQVMKVRAMVRDAEVPGLVQRYTEAVALDAFTESSSSYRLHDEQPGSEVLAAAATRPVLPMVAEALRRVLPVETQLEALGGSEAVPRATDTDLDARSLGFTDRERRMLSYIDGEATIEDIVLAAGVKPDKAYKVLAVAKHLGLIEVRPPTAHRPQPSAELDVQRLDAKYEQVQDADYFTILGLPKNAGTEEVQRAYDRLAEEFDPIRFSAHPDPSLQQRAAVVSKLLEEAARALEDDRRRAEYARHLLD
jgi:hypothetical protein